MKAVGFLVKRDPGTKDTVKKEEKEEILKLLLIKRANIIKNAQNKMPALVQILEHLKEIKQKVSIVVDFIISVLPIFAVLGYGLAKYIVIIFFGHKYITAVPGVSLIVLFSFFYLAYALLRGILDGLFSFPYVNFICLSGFLATAISSLLFHENISFLALDFGLGLLFMGVMAFYVLIKKGIVSLRASNLLISFFLISSSFLISLLLDRWIEGLIFNDYLKFGMLILYRAIIILFLFLLYWKPKSLWSKELFSRVRL